MAGTDPAHRRPVRLPRLPVGVGESREGPLWVDLGELPHLLIGGHTGSGKSVFLRQLLTGLLLELGPDRLRLALVDLKGGTELNLFERLPHLMAPVAREQMSCLELFEMVTRELYRRQALLDSAGLEDIGRWNAVHPDEALPYILVVVDEVAELSAVESKR
jgi:DNA segregation ATPase FtsK/SpoIIIE, S-DNA-T family